jgi:hypothetical protein
VCGGKNYIKLDLTEMRGRRAWAVEYVTRQILVGIN